MRQVAGPFLQLENLVLCKMGALLDARKVDQGTLEVPESWGRWCQVKLEGFKLR